MKVAIIADTHMPRRAASLPLDCATLVEQADLTLHAGDFIDEGAVRQIQTRTRRLEAVHGNVDTPAVRRELPEKALVEVEGLVIGLIHDAGRRQGRLARMRRLFPDANAVVFGHSHLPLLEGDGEFQIFNPGSPTDPRRAPHPTMGVAHIVAGKIEFELVRVGKGD